MNKSEAKINKPQKARRTDRYLIAQLERLYPLGFWHLELDGHIDIPRLKDAITQTCQIVPEVLCSFDIKRERWVDQGFTADAVVLEDTNDFGYGWRWDLFSDTQLKINVRHHEKGDSMIIAFSHILSDGTGVMQYLHMLVDLYNGGTVPTQIKNTRDIMPFVRGIRPKPRHPHIKVTKADGSKYLPFDDSSDRNRAEGKEYGSCFRERLSTDELAALKAYAKSLGCTVNDALLAAYARVAARLLDTDFVVLPCPTDLRQFFTEEPELTIANMVSAYVLPAMIGSDDDFSTTMKQIHEYLRVQKEYRRCFVGLRSLGALCDILPPTMAQATEKLIGFVLPLAYTNMGVFDDQKLQFEGCAVTDCLLVGSYRRSPDFTLSVSSFRGELSLCSAVLGSDHRRNLCQDALRQIKNELLARP
jgi:NRPS condensation-like uncharacterized protein